MFVFWLDNGFSFGALPLYSWKVETTERVVSVPSLGGMRLAEVSGKDVPVGR